MSNPIMANIRDLYDKIATLETRATELETPNIVQLYGPSNLSIPSVERIVTWSAFLSNGTKLTIDSANQKVQIGANVSLVRATFTARNSGAAGSFLACIKKNSSYVITGLDYRYGGTYCTVSVTALIEVIEGDTISFLTDGSVAATLNGMTNAIVEVLK